MKILKYEFLNIARNRWVFVLAAGLFAVSLALIRIAGDFSKAVLSLSSVVSVLVPLIASLFTVVYWYYAERFTELLLTQPVVRRQLILARWLALCSSMAGAVALGMVLPFAFYGGVGTGVLLVVATTGFLAIVFVTLGMLIAASCVDRMKGIGLVLAIWFYFAVLHDGLVLLVLLALREYPLDLLAGILGSVNPIGLVRVIHLMHYDTSLLLSYSGAFVRNILVGGLGMGIAVAVAALWLAVPLWFAKRQFERRDF